MFSSGRREAFVFCAVTARQHPRPQIVCRRSAVVSNRAQLHIPFHDLDVQSLISNDVGHERNDLHSMRSPSPVAAPRLSCALSASDTHARQVTRSLVFNNDRHFHLGLLLRILNICIPFHSTLSIHSRHDLIEMTQT